MMEGHQHPREGNAMRPIVSLTLTLGLAAGLWADAPNEGKARLKLTDEKLPLWEIRPLDRRDYVVTLDGAWERPPAAGASHYVNIFFPNGRSVSHRVID